MENQVTSLFLTYIHVTSNEGVPIITNPLITVMSEVCVVEDQVTIANDRKKPLLKFTIRFSIELCTLTGEVLL